jgi:hypothetical protein
MKRPNVLTKATQFRMRLSLVACMIVASAFVLVVPPVAMAAEQAGDDPTDAPVRVNEHAVLGATPVGGAAGVATNGSCTTVRYVDPVGIPVLRVDEGCDLDQYLFANSSPLSFSIDIDVHGGPVFEDGSPAPGNEFFNRDARITLRAFDVDDDYPGGDVVRELDQLLVNGNTIEVDGGGFLSGANDQWSVVTFPVSTSLLRFPVEE